MANVDKTPEGKTKNSEDLKTLFSSMKRSKITSVHNLLLIDVAFYYPPAINILRNEISISARCKSYFILKHKATANGQYLVKMHSQLYKP